MFAGHDIMKHIALGGFWFNSNSKKWEQAGRAILEYIEAHPDQRTFLGVHKISEIIHGMFSTMRCEFQANETQKASCKLPTKISKMTGTGSEIIKWNKSQSFTISSRTPPNPTQHSKFVRAISVVSQSGDMVKLQGNAVVCIAGHNTIGHILEILSPSGKRVHSATHVAIQEYDFLPVRHSQLRLPCLLLSPRKHVLLPRVRIYYTKYS